jgi:hypothetical protein
MAAIADLVDRRVVEVFPGAFYLEQTLATRAYEIWDSCTIDIRVTLVVSTPSVPPWRNRGWLMSLVELVDLVLVVTDDV